MLGLSLLIGTGGNKSVWAPLDFSAQVLVPAKVVLKPIHSDRFIGMLCSSASRVASYVTSMRCVSMLCSNDLHRAFGTMLRLVDATHARQEWLHRRTQNFLCLRLVLGHIEVANVGCPHRRCRCHQNRLACSQQLLIYIAKACEGRILPSIGGRLFRGVLCSSQVGNCSFSVLVIGIAW